MEDIKTNIPTDSAEKVIEEEDTKISIRQNNEMTDSEMDVPTTPVDEGAKKEDTVTNSKRGTNNQTILWTTYAMTM